MGISTSQLSCMASATLHAFLPLPLPLPHSINIPHPLLSSPASCLQPVLCLCVCVSLATLCTDSAPDACAVAQINKQKEPHT